MSLDKAIKLLHFSNTAVSRINNEWTRTQGSVAKHLLCRRKPFVGEHGRQCVAWAINKYCIHQPTIWVISQDKCVTQGPVSIIVCRSVL